MRASWRLLQSATAGFFKSANIPVVVPGQAEYDRSIAVSNRLYRFSRPDCVVQPESIKHVQETIKVAREQNLDLTIKCNGHSYAGHSTPFKGVSLDLRKMNKATLDMENKIVTMDAGCQWGHVYQTLINGRHDQFVINGGRCPTVGVGGFILGGGLGPFTRTLGMGCDTLVEATVVTADRKVVVVKNSDDPDSDNGKLFWALCGAGGGNFGIVVKMKLKVLKLRCPKNEVVAGRYQWFPNGGLSDEVLPLMNDFYTANWSNNLTIDSTWICDTQKDSDGIRFTMAFDGEKWRYERQFRMFIDKKDPKDSDKHRTQLSEQLKRRALPESSTRFLYETLVNQWLEETERAYPTNKTYEIFSSYVFKNDNKENIAKITKIIRDQMKEFREVYGNDEVCLMATWIHAGGKATERKPTDTAYYWREAVYHMYITVEWADKWMEQDMRAFHDGIKKELQPLSIDGEASFINFPDRDMSTDTHEKRYFGGNWEKLRSVKQIWDKDGFFKFSHGVKRPGELDDDAKADIKLAEMLANDQWSSFKPDDYAGRTEYMRSMGY